MLILPPLFKESPASPFLTAYYPDCVGMSPSGSPSNMSELRADHCRAVQPQSKSVGVRGMKYVNSYCLCLVSLLFRAISLKHIVMWCSNNDGFPQFQACVHTSSHSTSLMSVARLCAFGRIWWSWMSFTSFQNFPGIPPCIWLCVTLFWPPGTRIARYTADNSDVQTLHVYNVFIFSGFVPGIYTKRT